MGLTTATSPDRAVYRSQLRQAEYFIHMGAYTNGQDTNGYEYALTGAHPSVTKFLLAHGTDGATVLGDSADGGNANQVQFMVVHDAKPQLLKPTEPNMPDGLSTCMDNNNTPQDVIQYLRKHGAKLWNDGD